MLHGSKPRSEHLDLEGFDKERGAKGKGSADTVNWERRQLQALSHVLPRASAGDDENCPHLSDVCISAVLVHGFDTDLQEMRAQNRTLRSTGSIRVHRRRSAAPWRKKRYPHPPNGLVKLLDLMKTAGAQAVGAHGRPGWEGM